MSLWEMSHLKCKYSFSIGGKTLLQIKRCYNIQSKFISFPLVTHSYSENQLEDFELMNNRWILVI